MWAGSVFYPHECLLAPGAVFVDDGEAQAVHVVGVTGWGLGIRWHSEDVFSTAFALEVDAGAIAAAVVAVQAQGRFAFVGFLRCFPFTVNEVTRASWSFIDGDDAAFHLEGAGIGGWSTGKGTGGEGGGTDGEQELGDGFHGVSPVRGGWFSLYQVWWCVAVWFFIDIFTIPF